VTSTIGPKDNLLRHNLDVMHIEKNFCDNIIHTVMNVPGKTKDNEKARMDLPLHCKRPEMELQLLPNGKYLKSKVVYNLSADEAKSICQWLKELRMPDGYCSNLSRCGDVNSGRLHRMKSHDSHVFLERLLPIAFSSFPNNVINPLTEISQFFKDLCASTLRMDELVKMDQNMPITLCKLEQVSPLVSLILWNIFLCISHSNLGSVDLFNVDGCILLKGSWVMQSEW